MRIRYSKWDDAWGRGAFDARSLLKIFNQLLLRTGGDVDEALRWMEQLGARYGFFDENFGRKDLEKLLEKEGIVSRQDGRSRLTRKGERFIREDSLMHVFGQLAKGGAGEHRVGDAGRGGEKLTETRSWQFGDTTSDLDSTSTLRNAIRRAGFERIELAEDDLEVYETEHLTSTATVLAIDVSHSMVLYGEDRFTPAKQVALALTELILRRFRKDTLDVVLFGDDARPVPIRRLPYVEVGPFHTNTRAGLATARQILMRKRQANKQIFMITDGKPSALTERGRIYKNPFGLDRRIVNKTLEEAALCRRRGIVITTFMIASDPYLREFVEELTRVNRGRAYFTEPDDVGSHLLVDFIRNRNRRVR
jgi:uncharacterized protein with von Willebrand factor type A (vWA) domain